jgi:hypothetical protein
MKLIFLLALACAWCGQDGTAAEAQAMVNPVAAALPLSVLTNDFQATCPFCKTKTTVPGKSLMGRGGPMVPGGIIEDRSATIKCKCGESLSVSVSVFVPTPQVKIVKPSPSSCTFTKPKLRAPSDKP